MKFRRRPIEIEAEQFLKDKEEDDWPDGVEEDFENDGHKIQTVNGVVPINGTDWIIRTKAGNIVVDDHRFKVMYEEIPEVPEIDEDTAKRIRDALMQTQQPIWRQQHPQPPYTIRDNTNYPPDTMKFSSGGYAGDPLDSTSICGSDNDGIFMKYSDEGSIYDYPGWVDDGVDSFVNGLESKLLEEPDTK